VCQQMLRVESRIFYAMALEISGRCGEDLKDGHMLQWWNKDAASLSA
jgi:hypothetical protein